MGLETQTTVPDSALRNAQRARYSRPPTLIAVDRAGNRGGELDAQNLLEGYTVVTAPMLGTFNGAPKPGAEPFVQVEDSIEAETTLGIIEEPRPAAAPPGDGLVQREAQAEVRYLSRNDELDHQVHLRRCPGSGPLWPHPSREGKLTPGRSGRSMADHRCLTATRNPERPMARGMGLRAAERRYRLPGR